MIRQCPRWPLIVGVALVTGFLSGQALAEERDAKDAARVTIPPPDNVGSVEVEAFDDFPGGPATLTLKSRDEFTPVLDWLKSLDWDPAKSKDASVIRIAPVAQITVKSAVGKPDQTFLFARRLVIHQDRYWPVEIDKLAEIIKGLREKK